VGRERKKERERGHLPNRYNGAWALVHMKANAVKAIQRPKFSLPCVHTAVSHAMSAWR
jgi:hypothetical protein